MDPKVGAWDVCVSKSSGRRYYYHAATKASLWSDDALPAGWGWGKASEAAPKFFQNLYTGERTATAPTAAAAPPSTTTSSSSSAPSLKRPRAEEQQQQQQQRPLPRLPELTQQELSCGLASWPEVAPPSIMGAVRKSSGSGSAAPPPPPPETPYFTACHTFMLRQLMRAALQRHSFREQQSARLRAALLERHKEESAGAGGEGQGAGEEEEEEGGDDDGDAAAARQAAAAAAAPPASRLTIIDLGAGAGTATEFFLAHARGAAGGAQVYACDLWDKSSAYYAAQLAHCGNEALAEAWSAGSSSGASASSGGGGGALFERFVARFWDAKDDSSVVPCTFPAAYCVRYLVRQLTLLPELVYIDAELCAPGLADILESVWEKWMEPEAVAAVFGPRACGALVAGGGWDLSPGVRAAVSEFAARHALPLHVEGGKAWTVSVDAVRETRNAEGGAGGGGGGGEGGGGGGGGGAGGGGAASAEQAQAVELLRVRGSEAEHKAAVQVWQAEVFAVIDDPKSTAADLARAVGSHGGPGGSATGAAAAAAAAAAGAGAAGDAFHGEPWIDGCGDDRRHTNALMRAAKAGRADLVEALVDAHGAGVNVQAERSSFTALHLSTYEGREGVVRALLARGASAALLNKYGETALAQAEGQCKRSASAARRAILAMLQEAAAKAGGGSGRA